MHIIQYLSISKWHVNTSCTYRRYCQKDFKAKVGLAKKKSSEKFLNNEVTEIVIKNVKICFLCS